MDPISIAGTIVGGLLAIGAGAELSSRQKGLQIIGQNDITESNCTALCVQLRTRWNELCLAQSDEAYLKDRWQQAAIAASVAAGLAAALTYAASAAAASVYGLFVALVLWAASLVAAAAAVAAAGYASSAFTAFNTASTTTNGRRSAFLAAQNQMLLTCGTTRTNACTSLLPPCP